MKLIILHYLYREKKICYCSYQNTHIILKPREGISVMCFKCLHESNVRAACLRTEQHQGTCKTVLPHLFSEAQFDVLGACLQYPEIEGVIVGPRLQLVSLKPYLPVAC